MLKSCFQAHLIIYPVIEASPILYLYLDDTRDWRSNITLRLREVHWKKLYSSSPGFFTKLFMITIQIIIGINAITIIFIINTCFIMNISTSIILFLIYPFPVTCNPLLTMSIIIIFGLKKFFIIFPTTIAQIPFIDCQENLLFSNKFFLVQNPFINFYLAFFFSCL